MTFTKPVNTACTFTPTVVATAPYDAGPFSYAWDFGDGVTSALTAPTHTYTSPGLYSATLSVANEAYNISASSSEDIFISGPVNPGTVANSRLKYNGQTGGAVFYTPAPGDFNRVDLCFNYGNTTNQYLAANTNGAFGQMTDPSLQIDMLVPTKVDGYSLIYADISYHGLYRWEIFGSNDTPLADGSNMALVDQKDIGYLSVNPYTTSITPVTYRYYRLVCHASNNGNPTSRFYEFRLLRSNP